MKNINYTVDDHLLFDNILSQKETLRQILGSHVFENKLEQAKYYLKRMKIEFPDVDHKYLANEKNIFNEENYKDVPEQIMQIESMIWIIAGIELDNQIIQL